MAHQLLLARSLHTYMTSAAVIVHILSAAQNASFQEMLFLTISWIRLHSTVSSRTSSSLFIQLATLKIKFQIDYISVL